MSLSSTRPHAVLQQGKVIGCKLVERHGSLTRVLDRFLGIPYALSTGGERRFREAVPVPAGEGVFEATKWGLRCPAGERDDVEWGEDCLNLNIFRPESIPRGSKVPVLVYIHGGSFNFGDGRGRGIASMVAWSERPMIGVTFNYRLGAFGFLNSRVGKEEGSLNLGLKDQNLLLRWVRENIHAFGGDEGDITVMGASAGAHSVSCPFHLVLLVLSHIVLLGTVPQCLEYGKVIRVISNYPGSWDNELHILSTAKQPPSNLKL